MTAHSLYREDHEEIAADYRRRARELEREFSGVRPGWVSTDLSLLYAGAARHEEDARQSDPRPVDA